jgi:hypothetical protein
VSTYWVHVVASIPPLERRVAPDGRPARPALVPLGTAAVLVASAAAGLLLRERTGAVLVAAGFALAFAVLLLLGVAPALRNLVRNRPQRAEQVQVS